MAGFYDFVGKIIKKLSKFIRRKFRDELIGNSLKISIGAYNVEDDLGYVSSYRVINGRVKKKILSKSSQYSLNTILLTPTTKTARIIYKKRLMTPPLNESGIYVQKVLLIKKIRTKRKIINL